MTISNARALRRAHARVAVTFAFGTLVGSCSDPAGPSDSGLGIVYSIQMPGVYSHDLFLIGEDGKENAPFASKAGDKISPSWSPDGRTLAFQITDIGIGRFVIDAVRPDGSGRRTLYSAVGDIRSSPPSWSGAGRVAFVRGSDAVGAP